MINDYPPIVACLRLKSEPRSPPWGSTCWAAPMWQDALAGINTTPLGWQLINN